MPKEICAWLLRGDLQRLIHLLYDVGRKPKITQTMIKKTFCGDIVRTTAVETNRDNHLDVLKQIAKEKRRILLHPLHAVNKNKYNSSMAAGVLKRNQKGCLRPFVSTRMGSKWTEVELTRLYYNAKTEQKRRTV